MCHHFTFCLETHRRTSWTTRDTQRVAGIQLVQFMCAVQWIMDTLRYSYQLCTQIVDHGGQLLLWVSPTVQEVLL